MSATNLGRIDWGLDIDDEGYRTYKLKSLIQCSDYNDGPFTALFASGNPVVGSYWAYGNDIDPWCFCYPTAQVSPVYTNEPCKFYEITHKFSNKPLKRCQDNSINNPLDEPIKISGSFTRYNKENVEKDRFGDMILSSSHEPIRGIQKPCNSPSVVIEFNQSYLGLDIFSPMVTTVNDSDLWGLGPRTIMLANVTWSRLLYGTCSFYYNIKLEFEVRYEGWDLDDVLDKGFKVRKGNWTPAVGTPKTWTPDTSLSVDEPKNFVVWKDANRENFPTATPLKNGDPLMDPSDPQFLETIELLDESNFYLLGIPSYL